MESKKTLEIEDNKFIDEDEKKISRSNMEISKNKVYYIKPGYRWLMLFLGIFGCVCFGPSYINWPPFRDLLEADGAYDYLCPDVQNNPLYMNGSKTVIKCAEKYNAINVLAGFSISIFFTFTFIAGLLVDFFGSKICILTGLSSQLLGYFLFSVSGSKFHAYKAAIFFIAAGTDASLFGLLSISNLFPSKSSTVIAALGAARSLSLVDIIIMKKIHDKFKIQFHTMCIFYVIMLSLWIIAYFFLIPYAPFPKLQPNSYTNDINNPHIVPLVHKRPNFTIKSLTFEIKNQIKDFRTYGLTWGYLALLPLPAFAFIRNSYFSMIVKRILPTTESLFTLMNPLSVIPCPVLGYLADKISPSLCIALCALMSGTSLFFGLFSSIPLEYLSVSFNWIFISFLASEFYCYVATVYPQEHLGKLVGVVIFFGGLVSNVSTYIYKKSLIPKYTLSMDILVVGMSTATFVIAVGLYLCVELPYKKSQKYLQETNDLNDNIKVEQEPQEVIVA